MSAPPIGTQLALTIDVEDYFHPSAFRNTVAREQWDSFDCRVVANTEQILDLLERTGVQATFYVLGWVAEKFPHLVREIHSRGHELGCHSYWHSLIYDLDPKSFREDTERAKACIEQAAGVSVGLYRAPSFSITPKSVWAIEILAELGFTQDSSIFPIAHDLYGFTGAPPFPYVLRFNGAQLVEFPPPTIQLLRWRLPVTGGGYLRLLPMSWQVHGLRKLTSADSPSLVYLHPWEVDPGQPRLPGPLRSQIRHYTGLRKTETRLRRLLQEFSFTTVSKCLQNRPLPVFELSNAGEGYTFGEALELRC